MTPIDVQDLRQPLLDGNVQVENDIELTEFEFGRDFASDQQAIDELDHVGMFFFAFLAQLLTKPRKDLFITGSHQHYGQKLRFLTKSCERYHRLPSSCVLQDISGLEVDPSAFARGGFADVHRGTLEGVGEVAVKRIRADEVQGGPSLIQQFLCREAVIWKHCRHRNVVPFIAVFTQDPEVCLISKWMVHGNVIAYLTAHLDADVQSLILDVFNGCHYIHSLDIVHGDLKSANILINEAGQACISDFGIASIHDRSPDPSSAAVETRKLAGAGSARWLAPELLFTVTQKPTFASDVYAFGVVLWEILTCRVPYEHISTDQSVMLRVSQGLRPCFRCVTDWPADIGGLRTVMEDCWATLPQERPRIDANLRRRLFQPSSPRKRFPMRPLDKGILTLLPIIGIVASCSLRYAPRNVTTSSPISSSVYQFPLPSTFLVIIFAIMAMRYAALRTYAIIPVSIVGPSTFGNIDHVLVNLLHVGTLVVAGVASGVGLYLRVIDLSEEWGNLEVINRCSTALLWIAVGLCGLSAVFHDTRTWLLLLWVRCLQRLGRFQSENEEGNESDRVQLYVSNVQDTFLDSEIIHVFEAMGEVEWISRHPGGHCIVQYRDDSLAEFLLRPRESRFAAFRLSARRIRRFRFDEDESTEGDIESWWTLLWHLPILSAQSYRGGGTKVPEVSGDLDNASLLITTIIRFVLGFDPFIYSVVGVFDRDMNADNGEHIALDELSSSPRISSETPPQEQSDGSLESGDCGLTVEKAKQIINGLDVFLSEEAQRAERAIQGAESRAFLDSYRRSLRRLRNLCERYGELPSRCIRPMQEYPRLESEYPSPMGRGGHADVFRGSIPEGARETAVALKRLRMHAYGDKERLKKIFMREAALWSQLKHPNILPFIAVYINLPRELSIVSQWMVNGDIVAYISSHPEADVQRLILNVVDGLTFMHTLGVVHGDLKSGNVLINEEHNACLSDFGLSTIHHTNTMTPRIDSIISGGSLQWCAPEVLLGNLGPGTQPDSAVDVYAFGILLWEVLTCRTPYDHIYNDMVIWQNVVNGMRPCRSCIVEAHLPGSSPSVKNGLYELMLECWSDTSDLRPKVDDFFRNRIVESSTSHGAIPVTDVELHGRTRVLAIMQPIFGLLAIPMYAYISDPSPTFLLLVTLLLLASLARHILSPTLKLASFHLTFGYGLHFLLQGTTRLLNVLFGAATFVSVPFLSLDFLSLVFFGDKLLQERPLSTRLNLLLVIWMEVLLSWYPDVSYVVYRFLTAFRRWRDRSTMAGGAQRGVNTQIYVTNLPETATKDSLREMFVTAGEVDAVSVHYWTAHDKLSRPCHAIVSFQTDEGAHTALRSFQGYMYEGRRMRVKSCSIVRWSNSTDPC
uniref:Kinase-like protein n=1 Tax=Moniliophthora roreri TaxID=221103 RepID=A0A0W0FAJ2_MONRR